MSRGLGYSGTNDMYGYKKIYINIYIYLSQLMNEIPCNHHISHSDATGSCETCSTFESPVFQNTTSSFCRDAVANMS